MPNRLLLGKSVPQKISGKAKLQLVSANAMTFHLENSIQFGATIP
jgi:hypothetical protein